MNIAATKYCLDANVLIKAWNEYYSPEFCPDYWKILNDLGENDKIFVPETVFDEITRTDDDLSKWLMRSNVPVRKITEAVTLSLKRIYAFDPLHKHLVDNIKQRSIADPWVIAHAIHEKATVVTKENKETALNTKRIKIPNVCDNMEIRWINDFEFIQEIGIMFSCKLT